MPIAIPNIKDVFAEALEFDSMAERHAYLKDACRDNTPLRAEVASLYL
jgi:hypothetical protein